MDKMWGYVGFAGLLTYLWYRQQQPVPPQTGVIDRLGAPVQYKYPPPLQPMAVLPPQPPAVWPPAATPAPPPAPPVPVPMPARGWPPTLMQIFNDLTQLGQPDALYWAGQLNLVFSPSDIAVAQAMAQRLDVRDAAFTGAVLTVWNKWRNTLPWITLR